jgi:predicted ATPase/DNA-binding SARP family transcriptional activator
VRFRVLGPVDLVDADGSTRTIGSTNQRTVLAALLASRAEMVTLDTLIDALWGEAPPRSAVTTLRTYVSRLRAQIGDVLITRGHGFALDVPATDVDAGRFEDLVETARQADPATAVGLFDDALALWRGPAFGDRFDVGCVRGEARRLEELRTTAGEARIAALLSAARPEEAVAAAEALVADAPLREGAWIHLIEALAASQRTAEALRAFQRASEALAEAGLEPSRDLRSAEAGVLTRAPAPLPSASPPSLGAPERFVPPAMPSSFVGRDADRDRIVDLLDRVPLVTLIGPGGVGKTRLALEVAHAAAGRTSLGARVIELAQVSCDDDVPDAIVASLGLSADGASAVEMLDRARRLDLLVVLDNAEHVIDAVAGTVQGVLDDQSAMRLLVTSRERLGVDGEYTWTVAPLGTVGAEAPARRLFVDRARAAMPDIDLSIDDDVVARLVQRLDGLPLAIEMAAAQLPVATMQELADVLEQRYDVLQSPRRNVAERHRSLAAVLEWSEARLTDRERAVLADLSIFNGPIDTSDLDGVLPTPGGAAVVRSLAARSLVDVDRTESRARFALLQTVRAFAHDRLRSQGRVEEMARRHAAYYAVTAAVADRQLRGLDEAVGHRRLEDAFGEVRAAHRWARHNDLALACELTAYLHHYAQSRLVDEPLRWAEELVDVAPGGDPHVPAVLASAATRAIQRGDLGAARRLAERGVEIASDGPDSFGPLEAVADSTLFSGRLDDSEQAYRTLADRAFAVGDLYFFVMARTGVVLAQCYAGRSPNMDDLAEIERLDLGPSTRGWLHYARGEALGDRDPARAFAEYERAMMLATTGGNRLLEGVALVSSCALRARAGDVGVALGTFDTAIRHWQRLGATAHQATTLRNLPVLLRRIGEAEFAAELIGVVEHDVVPTYGAEAKRLDQAHNWALERLGAERFEDHFRRGQQRDRATIENWTLTRLARFGADAAHA